MEAYAALEAMVKDEERTRPQVEAKDTDLPREKAEDRYDSATEEDAGPNSLPTCGERTAMDKAKNPIANSESGVQRFRAPRPETLDIG